MWKQYFYSIECWIAWKLRFFKNISILLHLSFHLQIYILHIFKMNAVLNFLAALSPSPQISQKIYEKINKKPFEIKWEVRASIVSSSLCKHNLSNKKCLQKKKRRLKIQTEFLPWNCDPSADGFQKDVNVLQLIPSFTWKLKALKMTANFTGELPPKLCHLNRTI